MWKILRFILFSCEDQRAYNNSVQPHETIKPKPKTEIVLDGTCKCIGPCCCIREGKTSIIFN